MCVVRFLKDQRSALNSVESTQTFNKHHTLCCKKHNFGKCPYYDFYFYIYNLEVKFYNLLMAVPVHSVSSIGLLYGIHFKPV